MTSSRFEDWLTELQGELRPAVIADSRRLLAKHADETLRLSAFLAAHYADVEQTQPLLAAILAGYYRGGWNVVYMRLVSSRGFPSRDAVLVDEAWT
jgi:hypothetical protein